MRAAIKATIPVGANFGEARKSLYEPVTVEAANPYPTPAALLGLEAHEPIKLMTRYPSPLEVMGPVCKR